MTHGRPHTHSRSTLQTISAGGALSLYVGAVVLLLDLLTKQWATRVLSPHPLSGPSFLGGWLTLTFTTNTGAAFGVLADQGILFFVIGVVLLGVVIIFWRFLPRQRLLLRISLGLQLGGAAGNLIGRVREGFVVDFIQIKHWPVFNLADAAIVCGVALLMYYVAFIAPAPANDGTQSGTAQDSVPYRDERSQTSSNSSHVCPPDPAHR